MYVFETVIFISDKNRYQKNCITNQIQIFFSHLPGGIYILKLSISCCCCAVGVAGCCCVKMLVLVLGLIFASFCESFSSCLLLMF